MGDDEIIARQAREIIEHGKLNNEKVNISIVLQDSHVYCIYLNDYRICGAKPYITDKSYFGGSWDIDLNVIEDSLKMNFRELKEENELLKAKLKSLESNS